MDRRWAIIRALYNLELSKRAVLQDYTPEERLEIAQVGKENYRSGAVGEFGIRKVLERQLQKKMTVVQNFPHQTGIYWHDWTIDDLAWEVKSQPWWQPAKELVLQGDDTNFQQHYKKVSTLLIWSLKPDHDTLTPLALLDPIGVMEYHYGLVKGTGIGANLQVLHERGHMEILNDEWRKSLLSL